MKQVFFDLTYFILRPWSVACKRIFVSVCCFVASTGMVLSQAGTLNMLNAPQSPNAASLGKFVEIPVGHYSGIPEITIPLYEWNIKGLSLPISLSYHASGVKVKDIPGPVGTNWALNAGGVITRIVRGQPDDHDPYIIPYDSDDYYDSINRRRVEEAYYSSFESEFNLEERYDICLSTPGVSAANAVRNVWSVDWPVHWFNRMDTEIDLFYFNFLGRTGKFTFTNEGMPMLLSHSDLKIEYINRKFKLTDGQGIQYFLDSTEQALDEGSNLDYVGGGRLYTTSWYLSKIYIPHSDQTVTLSYYRYWNSELHPSNMYYDYHQAFYSRTDRIRYYSYVIYDYTYGNGLGGCLPYDALFPSTAPHHFASNLFLNEISWDGHKIKFFGSTNRTDLYKFKYDSIKVFSNRGEMIRKVDLQYGYFNSSSPGAGHKKLRLDKVIINDQQYQLDYIESHFGKTLPPINTWGQDMWGYYNGEDDESETIPFFKVFLYPGMDPNLFFYIQHAASGVKNPDYKYAQIGTLRSITYPTGGKTLFEYEGNDYSYYPFVEPGFNILSDPYTQMRFDSLVGKGLGAYTDPNYTADHASSEREFVLHKDQTITLWLTLGQFPFEELEHYIDSVYDYWAAGEVTLQKYNTATGQFENIITYEVYPVDSIGLPADQFAYDQVKYKSLLNGVFTHFLTVGRYKWRIQLFGWHMIGDVDIGCVFPYLKAPNVYTAGGIRIKKIQFLSLTDEDTSYVKQFEYKADTLSSGVLESPFANISTSAFCDYYHDPGPCGWGDCVLQESCGFLNLSSNPVIPLGNAQGGVIGYGRVIEWREDSSSIIYHFTTGQDDPETMADKFAQSPILPTRTRITEDNSWKRGLPIRVDYVNNAGQLVKQNFSSYLYDDSREYNSSISLALDNVILYPGGQFAAFNGYYAIPYFTVRGNQNALKVDDSVVIHTYSGVVTEVTKYEYHNSCHPHGYPIKITTRNSNGESVSTNLKYPQDFSVGGSPVNATAIAVKNLLEKHVTAPYIEKYVQKTDAGGGNLRTISAQYVRYKPSQPYPDTVFNLRLTGPVTDFQPATISANAATKDVRYHPVITFIKYDNYGNIVEQARHHDVKETFVWGYHHQYPVARITGADYDTAIALVNQNIINNPVTSEQLETELNKLRSGLTASAAVSTYTWKPLTGMVSETDPSGKTMYYFYDHFGRLALVRDQDRNILKKICYNYAGQPEACDWFGNAECSKSFTRNNCTNDSTGGQVNYTVPANTYYATTQAAADSLASWDIDANGQQYANIHGVCSLQTFYSMHVYGDFYNDNCDWEDEEPQPYYVDVPAGMFTSHVRQEDADSQAWWYAQEQANLYGECIDYVDLILMNYNTYSGYQYYIRLTDVNTWEWYEFQTFYGYGWLGTVPAGTYDIEIYTWNPFTGNFGFSLGCWYYGYGHTYNFYGVDIDEGCEEITIQ